MSRGLVAFLVAFAVTYAAIVGVTYALAVPYDPGIESVPFDPGFPD